MTIRDWLTALICLGVLLPVSLYADEKQDPDESNAIERARAARRQLWLEGMSPPEDQESSKDLRQAVRNALIPKIGPKVKASGKTVVPASQPATRPASRPDREPPATDKPGPPAGTRKISAEELGRLRVLSAKGVTNPVALADSLFLGGHYEEAYPLYRHGLQRELTDPDRAWVLFQMANCKRISDPPAANSLYKRVISEYPDSTWSGIAQVQNELIEWKNGARPEQVLEKAESMAEALREKKEAQQEPLPARAPPPPLRSGPVSEPVPQSRSPGEQATTRPTEGSNV